MMKSPVPKRHPSGDLRQSTPHFDVAIVGGGIAGMALAAGLLNAGKSIAVWERRDENDGAEGQAFILLASGIAALKELGVKPDRIGRAVVGIDIRDRFGELVRTEPLHNAFAVQRGDMIRALRSMIPAGVVRSGFAIDSVADHRGRIVLRSRAAIVATASFVVGCDGVRSIVRQAFFAAPPLRKGRVDEMLFTVQSAELAAVLEGRLIKWMDRDRHLALGGLDIGDGKAVVFLQFPSRGPDMLRDSERLKILGCFEARFGDAIPSPIRKALRVAEPYVWTAYDRNPILTVVRDRAALAGDAAQPLLPFTSLGVSNALVDARDLARAISERSHFVARARLEMYATARTSRSVHQVNSGRAIEDDFFLPTKVPKLPLVLEASHVVS